MKTYRVRIDMYEYVDVTADSEDEATDLAIKTSKALQGTEVYLDETWCMEEDNE